jgi:OTU domain-containing protein 5
LASTSAQFERYQAALSSQGLAVRAVEGDGNCLFRSVAHQVYGDDRLHGFVREKCMAYMESELEYFEQFVEGDRDVRIELSNDFALLRG